MEMSNLGVKVELTKMMMTNFSQIFFELEDMDDNDVSNTDKQLLHL